ncbi:hypothetical protein CYY_002465 [Polysphondylium violaceum]|uniref:Probable enoyl-CoA hydratase, mitochondrial n=1 Tax=Polysphondylium violaceum TaxID=133409 RepID=A0A8J4Q1K5_9MYCE|nr:hypothetical protein CYY_002465 [Polysphondylium violaceum]
MERINNICNHLLCSVPTSASVITTDQKYNYPTLLVNIDENKVATVTLNRPKVLNSFNFEMSSQLVSCLKALDQDSNVHCIILTGNEKSFACGADIKQMTNLGMQDMMKRGQLIDKLCDIAYIEKPIVAAVCGFALGGGCEVAMTCDIIVAGENAKFGQPEVKIGTIPGAGGTQRLVRAVGKSKAMEMVLTGKMIDAREALQFGLVSTVVPVDQVLKTAYTIAKDIASLSAPVIKLAKETVNKAYDSTLTEGLHLERRVFHSTFALDDRKEGMDAFANKRKPVWKNN